MDHLCILSAETITLNPNYYPMPFVPILMEDKNNEQPDPGYTY
jgi:hypothetical protein